MKYSITSALLCLFFQMSWAQTAYWTAYNFTVKPGSDETVLQLTKNYFEENPTPEGISVYLFENHFRDKGNNFSHSFIWAGTLDAMGNQYGTDAGDAWALFLSKMGHHIESSHSAGMGNRIATVNQGERPKPIQTYFFLKVNDAKKFKTAFDAYAPHRPKNQQVSFGSFGAGRSPDGETHWVIVSVDSFKEAMDLRGYRRESAKAEKAWQTYLANNGGATIVRTGLRIQLGQW